MVNIWPIIDQLLGARCQLCGAPGNGLCATCRSGLPRNTTACAICAVPLPPTVPGQSVCGSCQRHRPSFAYALVPLLYQPPVDGLVAALKYHHRLYLAPVLAGCLVDGLVQARNVSGRPWPELIIPVPMHRDHLRQRGFNQATELARVVSRKLGLPLSTTNLQHTGSARHQRGLRRAQRLRRSDLAFRAGRPCPAHVAVLDDVVTTTATAEQASVALRRAGAKTVEVWAVARTPKRR